MEAAKFAVPGPENKVQVPAPVAGTLPASVAVNPQTLASVPAFEAVGGAFTTMETWSVLAVQGAFVIVHWNT